MKTGSTKSDFYFSTLQNSSNCPTSSSSPAQHEASLQFRFTEDGPNQVVAMGTKDVYRSVSASSSSLPARLLSVESAFGSGSCVFVFGCCSGSVVLEASVGSVLVVVVVVVVPPSAGVALLSSFFCWLWSPPSRKVDQPFSRSSRSRVVSSTCTNTIHMKNAKSHQMQSRS